MPTQEGRRRHHGPLPAPLRKQTSKRSDEGTIGRSKLRTLMLVSQDRELVPQHQEFHVLCELGPPIPNEQPQNSSERKYAKEKSIDRYSQASKRRTCHPSRRFSGTPLGGFW
jgi:hypothetical protein